MNRSVSIATDTQTGLGVEDDPDTDLRNNVNRLEILRNELLQNNRAPHCVQFDKATTSYRRITSVSQLQPGDEIAWWRLSQYRWNCVVIWVNPKEQTVGVIGYDFMRFSLGKRIRINEISYKLNLKKDPVYLVEYSECHSRRIALDRARMSIGQCGYNLFTNRSRDFTRWCKTANHDINMNFEDKNCRPCSPDVKSEKIPLPNLEAVQQLDPADHIGWYRDIGYWHHAIVTDVSAEELTVVQFAPSDGSTIEIHEKSYKLNNNDDISTLEFNTGRMYKWVYAQCDAADIVIKRALSSIGIQGYNVFTKNCQHFATWCKTGVAKSKQVIDFLKVAGQKVAEVGAAALLRLPALALESVFADVLNYAGAAVFLVIEGCRIGKSAYELHLKRKRNVYLESQGLDPEPDGPEVTALCQRIGSGVFGLIGFLVGELLMPVGGGFIGGTVGSLIGEGLGYLIGRGVTKLIEYIRERKKQHND